MTKQLGKKRIDWCEAMFPGDGLELPTDEERDRADLLIINWSERWGERSIRVPRTHPDVSDEGYTNYLAGMPTNRAYLRSCLRRWWARTAPDLEEVTPQ